MPTTMRRRAYELHPKMSSLLMLFILSITTRCLCTYMRLVRLDVEFEFRTTSITSTSTTSLLPLLFYCYLSFVYYYYAYFSGLVCITIMIINLVTIISSVCYQSTSQSFSMNRSERECQTTKPTSAHTGRSGWHTFFSQLVYVYVLE